MRCRNHPHRRPGKGEGADPHGKVPTVTEPVMRFGELLRSLRVAAGFTQESLAEVTGLSSRGISDLERGINLSARRDTAELLADALKLSGTARTSFESAARGDRIADAATELAPGVHEHPIADTTPRLPPDPRLFTGRESDLERLLAAVSADGGVVGIYEIGRAHV